LPKDEPEKWDVAYLVGLDWIDIAVLVFRLDADERVEAFNILRR
jgi:hypothetical protein